MAERQVLTSQLRELEHDGIVNRVVTDSVPPRVDYFLSDAGAELIPVMEGMCAWGTKHLGSRQAYLASWRCRVEYLTPKVTGLRELSDQHRQCASERGITMLLLGRPLKRLLTTVMVSFRSFEFSALKTVNTRLRLAPTAQIFQVVDFV
jgi:HxlR-like helix-turn-helix